MIGAIAGDIIGSVYESHPIKRKEFPLFHPQATFTDDTVLTVAIASAILASTSYESAVRTLGQRYPHAGYGGMFRQWLYAETPRPYNSWGNGAAMRVSPIGFAFDSEAEVLHEAEKTAAITHNHPEGIKGAQATALAVFLARTNHSKNDIRTRLQDQFGYPLNRRVEEIRPTYSFDVSCQGTVPAALMAFFDANSYEDAVRNAVSLGGDSDTLACITGGIGEAYYGSVPEPIRAQVESLLPNDLWDITQTFCQRYPKQR